MGYTTFVIECIYESSRLFFADMDAQQIDADNKVGESVDYFGKSSAVQTTTTCVT